MIPSAKTLVDIDVPQLCIGEGQGKRLLSQGIRLRLRGSEKICITGRNGSGKTTLMKLLYKELSKRPELKLAYMPQNYEELMDPDMTAEEFLAREGGREERVMIYNRLASLRFTPDDMTRRIRELSGGQKAKLMLLSLTLSGADLLLMDEPTRNFSPLSGPVIRRILSGFGGAMISVSHDRKFIEEVPDTVYELTAEGLKAQAI